MNETLNIPKWFYIVAVVALLWNAMGVMAYIMEVTMTADDMMKLPENERVLREATPAWAKGAFAVAVFGGLLGSLLLLLKKSLALPVLVLSLVGIIIQMYNAFFIQDSIAVFGPGGVIMPLMIIIIAASLIYLARLAKSKGWIT